MIIDPSTQIALIVIFGWIFSLCFHEYGHGLAAYIGGDKSIREKGYLSFNPFAYTNVGLSIVLPAVVVLFGGVGLPGAAVMVNSRNLRGPLWDSFVSVAGPLFSVLFTAAVVFFIRSAPPVPPVWLAGLSYLTVLEIVVIIFNLLPFPGLDGYGIIEPFLPISLRARLINVQRVGIMLLLIALWTIPAANSLLWKTAYEITFGLGLSAQFVFVGRAGFYRGATPISVTVIALFIIVHLIRTARKKSVENSAAPKQEDISA